MAKGGPVGIVELDRQRIQTVLKVDYVYPFGPGSGGAALTYEADRNPFQIIVGSPGGRQTCVVTLADQPGTYLVDNDGNVFVALSGYTGVLVFPSCL